jgi:predicted Rossmann-fold nucleotide-binding protein
MHQKPCGLLNTCGFFDTLIAFAGHMVDQQFVEKEHWEMIQIDESPVRLLTRFDAYRMPKTDKAAWVLEMTRRMKAGRTSP